MENNYEDEIDSVQRCSHDQQNPYTMISNALTRDESISPNCRWLITYLLTNVSSWKINMKQVLKHVRPHMGRNKFYKIIEEAIESGYLKREDVFKNNLKSGFKYTVSETPKFKKCLRHPSFGDTEIRAPEKGDIKKEQGFKKEQRKNTSSKVSKEKKTITPSAEEAANNFKITFNRKIKKFEGLTDEIISIFKQAFPDIDVDKELNSMITWLLINPDRIGNKQFIRNWLTKATPSKPVKEEELPPPEIDEDLKRMLQERKEKIKKMKVEP